jgi:penicillin amidase
MSKTPRSLRRLVALATGSLLAGCGLLAPLPPQSSLDQRLQAMPTVNLPVSQPVTIYWNEHQVPFIVAETDDDAPFALGLVHAHLRLAQMAIYRRIAEGRIAEMGGPLAVDIDHGIRVLDFGRAAPEMLAGMPAETRRWLDRFVAGINHYQAHSRQLPYEYKVLGLQPEPWTAEDVLRFGRLAGTDVSWLVWFNLLKLRQRPDWPQIWARLVDPGSDAPAGTAVGAAPDTAQALSELLAGVSRSGSNSLAVGPARTGSGSAIIANDPHLGLNIPNTWLIVGLKSPSYHVVGLMVPGLPVFGIGRNPHVAWGGTNMRASASDLVDVSSLPPAERQTRTETIGVRWWLDEQRQLTDTSRGPMLAGIPQLDGVHVDSIALRWTGHAASDEVTAMLQVARAGDFSAFRDAFTTFAVPGQNMVYADDQGNIGKVLAVKVPDRGAGLPADVVVPLAESDRHWMHVLNARELPAIVNPPEGFVVSANNRPPDDARVGYFFSPDDRVERMRTLIAASPPIDVARIKEIQQDVYVASSVELRDALVARLKDTGVAAAAFGNEARVVALMSGWDGYYRPQSAGPVAFELFRHAIVQNYYQSVFGASDWAAFASVGRIKELLRDDILATPADRLAPLLRSSLARAAKRLDDFPTWGDMHRLVLQHPLAFLPLIGGRYRFADYPIGGSTDSLMKTAHGATDERHRASYGANARHISDLGDLDSNYFVILGGQDGWLNSATFLDQVPLWLEGRYITMPLRLETVQATFPRRTELKP